MYSLVGISWDLYLLGSSCSDLSVMSKISVFAAYDMSSMLVLSNSFKQFLG